MLVKVRVDYPRCHDFLELELDDNSTDEDIERVALKAGEMHALEKIEITWTSKKTPPEDWRDDPCLTDYERN